MEQSQKVVYYGLALITSLIGAVLILVTEFSGYWTSIITAWIGVDSAAAVILVPLALFLFYSVVINLLLIANPDKIQNKNLIVLAKFLCLITFILCIIGGIVFIAIVEIDGVSGWWFGAGFYGGVIGGILSFIFMYLAEKVE
ncbi:MAG: hypothetical protein JXA99_02780 [Candidatus Lokiarchaeota archaeon]|nr:hypothetical protein [Candidatus Lokiarchaeota archaeon]